PCRTFALHALNGWYKDRTLQKNLNCTERHVLFTSCSQAVTSPGGLTALYGYAVISARPACDEETPHWPALVLPTDHAGSAARQIGIVVEGECTNRNRAGPCRRPRGRPRRRGSDLSHGQ